MQYDAAAIISCFNAKDFINHKIQNILESTANIQIVIVECNGGAEIKNIPDDPRIKTVIFNDRISIWKAVNTGINMADSQYVVQANTDDLVHPEAYQKQINKLNEGYDITYFDYHIAHGYHKTWNAALEAAYTYYETPEDGYSVGNGLGMFPMWRKSLHFEKRIGHFDSNLEIYGDSMFWTNLAEAKKKFGHISEKLGVYAQRPGENLESNSKLAENDRKYLKSIS